MRVSAILFLFALLSFILVGCSSSNQVEVNCEAFQENNHFTDEIAVSAGDEFQVTLCSNPTTGYEWIGRCADRRYGGRESACP